MLTSRYAPVVALAVLGILIIAALGWFLAISPALGDATETREQAAKVDENTQQIQMITARIGQYEQELADAPSFAELVDLNAPSDFDVEAVRNRIFEAVSESGVYLFEVVSSNVNSVTGAEADPTTRVSNHVARLFSEGPLDPGSEAEDFVPVIQPNNEAGPVVEQLYGVPLTLSVTGTPAQVMNFLSLITDESKAALQFGSIEFTARQSDDAEILGVPTAEDGNVVAVMTGYLYVLNPPHELDDADALSDATLPSRSPFEEILGTTTGSDD